MDTSILVLASQSPRRRELLLSAGVEFSICPAEVDETVLPGESPENLAVRLAEAKAVEVGKRYPDAYVLGADTVVALDCGLSQWRILGKPQDEDDAVSMLKLLSAREHVVCTGFCLYSAGRSYCAKRAVTTIVGIRDLGDCEIAAYVKSGEPMDKAGAYAIQGKAGAFVSHIEGSYTNVVGLSLAEVLEALEQVGLWSKR